MESAATGFELLPQPASPLSNRSFSSEVIYFAIHVVVVYTIAEFGSVFLGRWIYHHIFPSLGVRTGSVTEFEATHLFLLNTSIALAAGFCNFRSRHIGAFWVWLIPTGILAFQIFTFHNSLSVFADNRWAAALNYYLTSGNPLIGDIAPGFRNIRTMFDNADFVRFIEQYRFTAPFYAGTAYSFGAFISSRGVRTELHNFFSSTVS